MIPSKHHFLAVPLFLIAAVSNFDPVSAGIAFGNRNELQDAVDEYCAGWEDQVDSVFDPVDSVFDPVDSVFDPVDSVFDPVDSVYGPIEDWDVSGITDMQALFTGEGSCNPPIGSWDVSNVINFAQMFIGSQDFNQDISGWDVGSGTIFREMFAHAPAFNQDISGWNVSSGTDFGYMFDGAMAFNQDISDWDVSSGITFYAMLFFATSFNQNISGWDVSSGTNFGYMFDGAMAFNQDISNWDVSSGINFNWMFYGAKAFNQDISKWNVGSGLYFDKMFYGATSFDQTLNCEWQKNTFFTGGDNVCTNSGANCGSGDTTCTLPDFATGGGDPHLKTFFGYSYSYHGQCDMVLLKSREFAAYAGLDIHIRTTRVDNAKVGYSYISGAAVKLGFDVLEVMEDGELLLNGNAASSPTTFAAGYPLRKTFKGNNNKIIVYDLDLTSIKGVHKPIQIRVNTKAKMIFVDVYGRFPDGFGLLGPPSDDSRMLARDGVTDLVGEWNSFGEEWQVRSDEPKLFHENRAPQYPQGCVYESSNTRAMTLRRRLMDGSAVTEKDAEGACSGSKGKSKEFCIADVMATGMLDLAEDEFYLIHE